MWDILEHTHEPLIVQNITTAKITDVLPSIVSSKQHLLAIADNIGTLHILEISWVLRNATPNEVSNFAFRKNKIPERVIIKKIDCPWLKVGKTAASIFLINLKNQSNFVNLLL